MGNHLKYLSSLENRLKVYRIGKIDNVTRISWELDSKMILGKAFNACVKGQRILDVGCGTGTYIIALAKKKRECHGVDPLLSISLAKADKRAKKEKTKVFLCRVVGEFLSYKNETFDLVLCLSTLQHVANQKNTLREIRRVLKNNGKLLISIPTTKNIHTLFREVVPKHFIAGFNITTIRKLLADENFQISETTGSGFFPLYLNKALRACHILLGEEVIRKLIEALDKVANRWLASAGNLIILCKKLSP